MAYDEIAGDGAYCVTTGAAYPTCLMGAETYEAETVGVAA